MILQFVVHKVTVVSIPVYPLEKEPAVILNYLDPV